MAQGAKLKGETGGKTHVSGDRRRACRGMAFEALNNAGVMDTDLLVILNDNDMSISPVGALNRYLARLMSGRLRRGEKSGEKVLAGMAALVASAKK